METQYFYSDGKGKFGPYTLETLPFDKISPQTLIWHKGLASWQPAHTLPELKAQFALDNTPPPLPANKEIDYNEQEANNIFSALKTKKRRSLMAIIALSFAAVVIIALVTIIIILKNDRRELPIPDSRYYESVRHEEPITIVTNSAKLPSITLYNPIDLQSTSATITARVVQGSAAIIREELRFSTDNKKFKKVDVEIGLRDSRIAYLKGLQPNTKYYYKLAIKTSAGVAYSDVKEFTTLPEPVNITFSVSKHSKSMFEWIKRCNISGKNKKLITACDYTNSEVRNKAVQIAGITPGGFNLGQVCDIFDYCYKNWKYVNDSQEESVIEMASKTLKNGLNGDCDDFAVLVASMILSIGGEARISCAYQANTGHAFAEVNIGKSDLAAVQEYIKKRYGRKYSGQTHFRTDPDGTHWLNLDWWARHPGGQYYQADEGMRFYLLQQYCEEF